MKHTYRTKYTCSTEIEFDIDGNVVHNVKFTGGCNGNLKGISALVKGKSIDEVIEALKGIDCNFKGTSCPNQLARALGEIKAEL